MGGDVPKACPECGGALQGYDHRRRIMKSYGGKKQYVLAPRNLCTDCGKLSTLLPDSLSPRKHYINEVRENLLDDVIDCDHVVVNNYPCEETVKFWKYELMRNTTHIEGLLKSIMADSAGLGLELLESSRSLLKELRDEGAGWLAAVNRIIYNSGNFIPVVYPPAFSSVFDDPDIPSAHKEEDHEKGRNSFMAERSCAEKISDHSSDSGPGNRSSPEKGTSSEDCREKWHQHSHVTAL
jgi:hypothetical protein